MFAPAATTQFIVGFSFKLSKDWTPVISAQELFKQYISLNNIRGPGNYRIYDYLAITPNGDSDGESFEMKAKYCQLSRYFCTGLGKIKNLKRVKIVLIAREIPDFFWEKNLKYKSLLKRFKGEEVNPVYEVGCDE